MPIVLFSIVEEYVKLQTASIRIIAAKAENIIEEIANKITIMVYVVIIIMDTRTDIINNLFKKRLDDMRY
jgi:hypothetical protein